MFIQFSSVKIYNFLTKVWIGKKFGSQSLASPTPSGLIAKVASPWGVIISNTNRKTQKRHKDKLPQEVQKKEVCFCKLKQTTKQSLGGTVKKEGLLGQASCSPQASKGCRRSWPHAAPPSPSSDLSCGQRCEKLVKHKKWNLVVEACAIMFPPIGFLGSAWWRLFLGN